MAKVKELDLGRSHQMDVCRFVRQELWRRKGGIVLADGVGLGKTYEALGTVVSYLAQLQHGKQRKQQQAYNVLVLVPPRLVSKWADELLLPNCFPQYLKSWHGHAHQAIMRTFSEDVVVLRRQRDLENHAGERRYRKNILPHGLYVVNWNLLLFPAGKKTTQIHKTTWDAIIVDEAHHVADKLLQLPPYTLLANPNTVTLLLTATPFQLSPQEMKGLFSATYGGYKFPERRTDAEEAAKNLYGDNSFKEYRNALLRYFKNCNDDEAVRSAKRQRFNVEKLLRPRMVRNKKCGNRVYHLVDGGGNSTAIQGNPFQLDDVALGTVLKSGQLIDLRVREARAYLEARDQISEASARRKPTFVAGALRQLLSTWEQFHNSASGRLSRVRLPKTPHPKVRATTELVANLLADEVRKAEQRGWVGKVLIFTTYVGSERSDTLPREENAHGTARALKNALTSRLRKDYPRGPTIHRKHIGDKLKGVLDTYEAGLSGDEKKRLRLKLGRFASSASAGLLLRNEKNLNVEALELRHLLENIAAQVNDVESDEESARRFKEHRDRLVNQIDDRYGTRDLVARYDGTMLPEDRDRHLRGFNSPFAPLVLIASSVGQEGIDLQRYCHHVIHYDLEWNPAKLEQREGRVDRQGRFAEGLPVNIYFLLCRDTYDERIMHAMVNRFRWHHVLLANRSKLQAAPGKDPEVAALPRQIKKIALDLRPPRI